jgi:hypothetical protein
MAARMLAGVTSSVGHGPTLTALWTHGVRFYRKPGVALNVKEHEDCRTWQQAVLPVLDLPPSGPDLVLLVTSPKEAVANCNYL